MIDAAKLISIDESKRDWYIEERNTASLIRNVTACLPIKHLTGDALWRLISLTWITNAANKNWRLYKVPALEQLFSKIASKDCEDLASVVDSMVLPDSVADAAKKTTGFVNFYAARRNSARAWCSENTPALRELVNAATTLGANNQQRIDLATAISVLPGITLPGGTKPTPAFSLLTPLIACLDPLGRFPIINGRMDVSDLLDGMGLSSESLENQVKHLLALIDHLGITDAYVIDVCASEIAADLDSTGHLAPQVPHAPEGKLLQQYDESERFAVQESATIEYRNRHNKVTNKLVGMFALLKPEEGAKSYAKYDLLLRGYDEGGRDLLIEVKPNPDKGSIRIAIGQLYDYRRHLNNSTGTDLAVLTIGKLDDSYLNLIVLDRGITALWFEDEGCQSLNGLGVAWKALNKRLEAPAL